MDSGINNHLKRISSELFIKRGSLERFNIDRSLDIIITKLKEYFRGEVSNIYVFGSYTRDTILPRHYDEFSDVDVMVEFNTEDYDKLKPESYRSKLKRFAEAIYSKALSVKDHPSIVIELDHIKFDLVPSIFDNGWFYDSIEIPDKDGGWMETEPTKFNTQLTDANKRHNSIVKPIIRLLKYWNAKSEYPYYSYELETAIAEMDFTNDNLESGFLYAIKKLSTWDLPGWADDKVSQLKKRGRTISELLDANDVKNAKQVLSNVLPRF